MNKNLYIWIIVAVVVVAVGVIWWVSGNSVQMQSPVTQNNSGENSQNMAKGTVYIAMTDAAVNMGAITAVNMTVDKVYLHSQGQGWVMVSQEPKTYSLLELKNKSQSELVVRADVPTDTYDQIWFHIVGVKITESGKVKDAKMPAADFTMNAIVKVTKGNSSTVKIDVLADQSIHKTAKAELIFAPVVKFESRSEATVSIDGDNMVTIVGGTVGSDTSAGMDVDGQVKSNFKIDADATIELNGTILQIIEKK